MTGPRWPDRAAAVAAGLVLDAVCGEPPARIHPVARFGGAMERLERRMWRDDRAAGTLYAAGGIGGAALVGSVATRVLGPRSTLVAATALAAAGRDLLARASQVGRRLEAGDLEAARVLLPSLVGRDPAGLDEKEMARAVIESVAENLADAVVATALWGVLAGAPGVFAHRAANTLDAMVGHRSERHARFGWAAARCDDLLAWPAARLTAVLVALSTPSRAAAVLRTIRRDAPAHPSPNAGVSEAAVAAALDLRLGGMNAYAGRTELRPWLGDGRTPSASDVARAVALGRRVVALTAATLALGAAAGVAARAARR